jgi:vacuolar iron transporter family protein
MIIATWYNWLVPIVFAGSLLFLAALGVIGARVGGAGILRPTIRVMFWGALAMAVTAGIGAALGTVV